MSTINSASEEPPHEIIDPWCLVHGWRDPDDERDEQIEREQIARFFVD